MFVYALILMMFGVPGHCVKCPPHPQAGIDIVDLKFLDGLWNFVNLTNLRTEQVGTYGDHGPHLAVDGDHSTAAVACNPCDQSLRVGPGWWKIYLDRVYLVVAVRLRSNSNQYDANYLQEFEVKVTYGDQDCCLCGTYNKSFNIVPLTRITVVCREPLFGNQVKVSRPYHAKFRPDALSIAEFELVTVNPVKTCT